MSPTWKTAWITGASSGIGRELALTLARRGLRVAVSARSAEKLAELAAESSNIIAVPLDVTQPADVNAAYQRVTAELGQIDLAVLNAGLWQPMRASDYSAQSAAASMAVNYQGLANCLEPLIPQLIARGSGHIAIVASVAGFRGLPLGMSYAPSKAAAISLAEVLYLELARYGVKVSLINPGFVETPMTSINKFPMPFIIKADDAARRIIRGLERGKFEITFPWQLVSILKFARILPYALYFSFVRTFVVPEDHDET